MNFVDTWAWVALALRDDQHHEMAVAVYRSLLVKRERLVTSDYILDESITLLMGRDTSGRATQFVDALLQRTAQDGLILESIDRQRFDQAWALRKRYTDHPAISFTDFTSIVVMEFLGITRIFSGDNHFIQVNRGFHLVNNPVATG